MKKDIIRNQIFREKLKINPVEITMEQGQLRWFDYVTKRK